MEDGKLPLGVLRQATLKLDSFISDMYEVIEDDDVSDEKKKQCEIMADIAYTMMANISYLVSNEIDSDEFFDIQMDMDSIEYMPEEE